MGNAVLNFSAILLPPEACEWSLADSVLPAAVACLRYLSYCFAAQRSRLGHSKHRRLQAQYRRSLRHSRFLKLRLEVLAALTARRLRRAALLPVLLPPPVRARRR